MAEPVGSGLRPARRTGLTSPETVPTPTAPTATRPPTPAQDLWTSRRTSQRQQEHARKQTCRGESPKPSHPAFTRWIEAELTPAQLKGLSGGVKAGGPHNPGQAEYWSGMAGQVPPPLKPLTL
jgi:hypothetical protein